MALPTGTEFLVASSIGGGAAVVGWFANRVIKVGDDVRQIKQAFYGDPDMSVPDGVVASVSATMATVDALATRVDLMDTRIDAIATVCTFQHGASIVRP